MFKVKLVHSKSKLVSVAILFILKGKGIGYKVKIFTLVLGQGQPFLFY